MGEWTVLLAVAAAYAVGSLSFAVVVSRAMGLALDFFSAPRP